MRKKIQKHTDVKKLTGTNKGVKNDKNKKEAMKRIIDLYDLTGLIIFDVFRVRRVKPRAKYQKFGSAGFFLINDIIKTLKLQYLLNWMCYEGD